MFWTANFLLYGRHARNGNSLVDTALFRWFIYISPIEVFKEITCFHINPFISSILKYNIHMRLMQAPGCELLASPTHSRGREHPRYLDVDQLQNSLPYSTEGEFRQHSAKAQTLRFSFPFETSHNWNI